MVARPVPELVVESLVVSLAVVVLDVLPLVVAKRLDRVFAI